MVYSTLGSKAMMAHQFPNSSDNTTTQLHSEKASSLAKDNMINSLEEIIIDLGINPKDVKGIEALIRQLFITIERSVLDYGTEWNFFSRRRL